MKIRIFAVLLVAVIACLSGCGVRKTKPVTEETTVAYTVGSADNIEETTHVDNNEEEKNKEENNYTEEKNYQGENQYQEENNKKEGNYRDDFIKTLLENEDEWYEYWGPSVAYQGALMFTDLNFDGKPEFIMQYGGGSMKNNDASAFSFSNNQLIKANNQFQNNLTGYYDTVNNKYLILGEAYFANGVASRWRGDFELSFNGVDVISDYYSSSYSIDENYTGEFTNTYFDGAKGYADTTGLNEITEDEYNQINEEKLSNLVNINMYRDTILCADWENYSASQKREALENAYDSFTYESMG